MRSVVAKAYQEYRATGHVSLFKSYLEGVSDGEQRRDFIYVDDAVKVILHFVDQRDVAGLLNCGTGRARTWLDLVRAVFAAIDAPADIRFVDMPEILRARYQYFTQANVGKLRAAGFQDAFRELEDGVGDYVRNYLAVGE
jgi:ADP-L-glycero-D-manno-heptose 6-epimerase